MEFKRTGLIHRLLAGLLIKVILQIHLQTHVISKMLSLSIYASKHIQAPDERFSRVRSPETEQGLTLPSGLGNGLGKSLGA